MNTFIEIAKKEAKKSIMDQKHGCVIVYKGKYVISQGFNYHISHYNHLWSIHAEIDAIKKTRKLKINLSSCDMYVVRISKIDESLRLSKPCDNCMKTIKEYKLRNIYYSVDI